METLYRVESRHDRCGPWTTMQLYDRNEVVYHRHTHTRRSPSDGPGWEEEEIDPPPSKQDHYVTFVRSIDELRQWFQPIHLRRLRKAKFVVGEYRLPPRGVKHGRRQAVGLREMGKHVRDIPITHILKGKL